MLSILFKCKNLNVLIDKINHEEVQKSSIKTILKQNINKKVLKRRKKRKENKMNYMDTYRRKKIEKNKRNKEIVNNELKEPYKKILSNKPII